MTRSLQDAVKDLIVMDPIRIDPTDRSPRVDFDFNAGQLRMDGESYPEDAAAFFSPLLKAVREHLASTAPRTLAVDLEMRYFNSSSAKALMNLFQLLEEAGQRGHHVTVNWLFHPDDDTMEEFGEDFALDFSAARFTMCPTSAPQDA